MPDSIARMPVIIRTAAIVSAHVAVTAVMLSPLVSYSALSVSSYAGDARQAIWTLAWNNHALMSRLPLFDCNIFYPTAGSLAYNEHLFGIGLFTLPIHVATGNPVLAYNSVWLLSFLLSGLAMHLLLKRYCGSHTAAYAGALIYTFSFYKMLHGHGHLSLVWTWLLPLSVVLLERWGERPGFARALLWGATIVLQSLASWYLAIMTVAVQCVAVAWWAPVWIRAGRLRQAWQPAVVTLAAVAAIWPFAAPYRVLPPLDVTEVARNSADVAAYLVPPADTWVGRIWQLHIGAGPRGIWGERTLFVGWIALALACLGAWHLASRRQLRLLGLYSTAILLGFALSLGPATTDGTWTPFSVISSLPGLDAFRAPARFALVLLLGVSVFAAFGARSLLESGRLGRALLLVLLPVMLSEWYVVQFPAGKPQAFPVPPIYRTDVVRAARALVSLPDYRATPEWFFGADYLYFSTAHWRPIVNGFGRAEPPEHPHVISHMNAFPGPNNARTMRKLGIDVVVLHAARIGAGADEIVRVALATGEYDLVARIGPDYAFRVRP